MNRRSVGKCNVCLQHLISGLHVIRFPQQLQTLDLMTSSQTGLPCLGSNRSADLFSVAQKRLVKIDFIIS